MPTKISKIKMLKNKIETYILTNPHVKIMQPSMS